MPVLRQKKITNWYNCDCSTNKTHNPLSALQLRQITRCVNVNMTWVITFPTGWKFADKVGFKEQHHIQVKMLLIWFFRRCWPNLVWWYSKIHYISRGSSPQQIGSTVNSEIFTRVLFSRNCEVSWILNLAKWQNNWYTYIMHKSRISNENFRIYSIHVRDNCQFVVQGTISHLIALVNLAHDFTTDGLPWSKISIEVPLHSLTHNVECSLKKYDI